MLVKIFERKWVIRFFGIALILAPFFNIAHSVLELEGIDKKFLVFYCWQFFKSAPIPQQVLQSGSILIGILMLRGAISAWKYALALLGCYIIIQFTQLNTNMRDNWNWIYLGVNVLLFFFIADQIVLKPRPAKAPQKPKPVTAQTPGNNFLEMPPEAASQFVGVVADRPPLQQETFTSFEKHSAPAAEQIVPSPAMQLVATSGGEVFVPISAPITPAPTVAPAPEQSISDAVKEVSEKLKAEAAAEADRLRNELERYKLEQAEQLKAEIARLQAEKEAALAQQAAELKSTAAPMPQNELRASSAKKVTINFEGFGNWATITDVSNAGIRVRAIAPAPPEITSRVVEMDLDSHLSVKLKFHQQDGASYFFKFVNLTYTDKLSLNRWLINLAS